MSFAYRLCRNLRCDIQITFDGSILRELGLPLSRKTLCAKDISKKYPDRLLQLLDELPATIEKQIEYSWNPKDCSYNLVVKADNLTVYRSHIMHCTDGIRGKIAVSEGLHVWEVFWPIWKRGTNATVGVGTSSAPLNCEEYKNLVGSTADSWGWDIIHCKALHGVSINNQNRTYPTFDNKKEMYPVPSTFFIVLDMDAGTLSFIADGEYLGVAFDGLRGQTLYPIIGCVWGSSEISLKYIGGMKKEVSSLKELCRRAIGQTSSNDAIETALIPEELKTYVLYKNPNSAYNERVLNPPIDEIIFYESL